MQDKINEIVKANYRILSSLGKMACDLKDELLDGIENLGARLPLNTLDQLINELG